MGRPDELVSLHELTELGRDRREPSPNRLASPFPPLRRRRSRRLGRGGFFLLAAACNRQQERRLQPATGEAPGGGLGAALCPVSNGRFPWQNPHPPSLPVGSPSPAMRARGCSMRNRKPPLLHRVQGCPRNGTRLHGHRNAQPRIIPTGRHAPLRPSGGRGRDPSRKRRERLSKRRLREISLPDFRKDSAQIFAGQPW
jgi:hypothetical protein